MQQWLPTISHPTLGDNCRICTSHIVSTVDRWNLSSQAVPARRSATMTRRTPYYEVYTVLLASLLLVIKSQSLKAKLAAIAEAEQGIPKQTYVRPDMAWGDNLTTCLGLSQTAPPPLLSHATKLSGRGPQVNPAAPIRNVCIPQ